MPKMTHQPDNLELMGALVEHHAAMAVADGIRRGKTDLLAHANKILRNANLRTLSGPGEVSKVVRELVKLGVAEEVDARLQLTDQGAKALAIMLYGRRWQEHVQPHEHRTIH